MRALLGLVVFNALLLLLGLALLRGLRPTPRPGLVASVGVAYMLGVSLLIIVGTVEIVLGIAIKPIPLALGCLAAVTAIALVSRRAALDERSPAGVAEASRSRPGLLAIVVLAGAGAALGTYLAALFAAARVSPAHEWDGWWVWTIRAKAVFYDGTIDAGTLLAGYSSYAPGLSLLYGVAMEAMASADAVTLHVQNWFFALGFVGALAGLLFARARPWIAAPAVLLVATIPALRGEALLIHADALLAYQVAVAVVLLLAWLEERAPWLYFTGALLLTSALLTKRDGLLFVACVLAALFVASWWERRWAWPRLAGASLGLGAIGALWWLAPQRLADAAPSGGIWSVVDDPGRFLAAIGLTLETVFDSSSTSLVGALVVMAVLLAALTGGRRLVAFTVAFGMLAVIGIAGTIAAELAFEISRDPVESSIGRLVITPLVVLGSVLALLLESAHGMLDRTREREVVGVAPPVVRQGAPAPVGGPHASPTVGTS